MTHDNINRNEWDSPIDWNIINDPNQLKDTKPYSDHNVDIPSDNNFKNKSPSTNTDSIDIPSTDWLLIHSIDDAWIPLEQAKTMLKHLQKQNYIESSSDKQSTQIVQNTNDLIISKTTINRVNNDKNISIDIHHQLSTVKDVKHFEMIDHIGNSTLIDPVSPIMRQFIIQSLQKHSSRQPSTESNSNKVIDESEYE